MSTIDLTPTDLVVTFSRSERLAGLVRDIRVPLTAIRRVTIVDTPVGAVRGIRAPGLAVPGRRKIGTWRSRRGRSLVSVRRGQPALEIELTGQRYERIVLGVDDAPGWRDRLVSLTA